MAVRTVECQQCQTTFEARDWRANRPTKYCSRRCRDQANTTRVTLTCVQCQQPFERKAYQADWSQERGPFCSMPCYGLWQRENVTGPANPMYGVERNPSDRASNRWYRNRTAALDRDGHRCRRCGSSGPLHVHHVVPWEPDQADPHALGNLETLCVGCHRRHHALPTAPNGQFLPSP